MKKALLAALVMSLPMGARAGGQQNPPVDMEFQSKVDKAIERGIAYLKGKRTPAYHKEIPNGNELILLTYIHAGVLDTDPDFQALLKEMLEAKLERTYKVALQAMCLEEIERVKHQGRISQCAQFLADNISDAGESRYGQPSIFADEPKPVPTTRPPKKDVETSARSFDPAKPKEPYESGRRQKPDVKNVIQIKRQRPGPAEHDHSNMQYHALGLRACYDAGMRFEPSLIKLVDDHWRKTQIADSDGKDEELALDPKAPAPLAPGKKPTSGTQVAPVVKKVVVPPAGWGYQGTASKSHGSMTVGAVGALCILDYMQGKEWRDDKEVLKGLQWMNKHFSVTENPILGKQWHYYYLYGVERAGMLFGTEQIGSHKWYREGADYLLANQSGDGRWNDVVDTCFAILFLRRATRKLNDVATGPTRRP
jgi:hypothetical protein